MLLESGSPCSTQFLGKVKHFSLSLTKKSRQGEAWAEFSTLEDAVCLTFIYHAVPAKIGPNLELKTGPKPFLGSLT
jgi:hypothetical protein